MLQEVSLLFEKEHKNTIIMLLFLVYSVFAIDTSYFDLDSPPQSP